MNPGFAPGFFHGKGVSVVLRESVRLLCIAGLVVLLDQVTKCLVVAHFAPGEHLVVFPGFFDLVHVHNPGGAFGFLAGSKAWVRKLVFLFASGFAGLLVLYFYFKTPGNYPWLKLAFAMIFGGAVGNLADRVRFGYVIDFLDVYWKSWHWPAFNVADSAICIGIGIFAFCFLFKKLPENF